MPSRDWNGFSKWGEKPDPGVAVSPSSDLFLFALMPVEGAQFQNRADVAGGVLVVAYSAADARLLAADSEYLQENSVMPDAGITHSSAFEMRSYIMFSKSTAIQWKENERWWLPNF